MKKIGEEMKVLIIGSGGREHAIGYACTQSVQQPTLFFAPGNAGTATLGTNVGIAVDDVDGLVAYAVKHKISLTIVGPEIPLALGVVDRFKAEGLRIFGPGKDAAQLEASKSFSKNFMQKYAIPTAQSISSATYDEAVAHLATVTFPIVIKADGLAAGKGVVISETMEHAVQTLDEMMRQEQFGASGTTVVIEEFLTGTEASLLCFVDGKSIVPLASASDYKRAYDGNLGENTGGMGSISPAFNFELTEVQDILDKTLHGIQEENFDYHGIIFIGFMMTPTGPMVLEYNVRFGDPETESVLLRLTSDFIEVIEATIDEQLASCEVTWSDAIAMTVIVAAEGYPEQPITGAPIKLPKGSYEQLPNAEDVVVFHAGTKMIDGQLCSSGGRVLAVSTLADSVEDAQVQCYQFLEKIVFPKSFYRKDIGESNA